ncbi:hypothetical protein BSKO_01232 [Bryopsis sp. KO-2023]|nr:hypothetical protein BSKO_01232 [Bryopsis sp. KO-2023]
MATLKKYLKKRTYRERDQPASRTQFGLLEKHKDYVQRARRFQRQRKTIETLQKKAAEKNPDEFHFSMEYQRTNQGVPIQQEGRKLSAEEEALLESQDQNYVNLKLMQERKKLDKLSAQLHFIGVPASNKHIVFADSVKEAKKFSPSEYFDTPEELLSRSFNRPRRKQLEERVVHGAKDIDLAAIERSRTKRYKVLEQRVQRCDKLASVAERFALRKQLAKGDAVDKVDCGDGTIVHKWRMTRKK